MLTTQWNREISDLRERAVAVMRPDCAPAAMSARQAARCLSGVVALIVRQWSVGDMQRACAELVRHEPAWRTSFGQLPTGDDGAVAEPVVLLAVVARGVLSLAGADNTRDALAFWASESDPAVWTLVTAE